MKNKSFLEKVFSGFNLFEIEKKSYKTNSNQKKTINSDAVESNDEYYSELYDINKSKINLVLDILRKEGVDAKYENCYIVFRDKNHTQFEIDVDHISVSDENIAWFQSSDFDRFLLRVFNKNGSFSWEPKTYNNAFGCDCHLVEWINNSLIFIYKEKHNLVVANIKNEFACLYEIHGDSLYRKNNILYFQEYGPKLPVGYLKIPELKYLGSMSENEARVKGLFPRNLGYLYSLKET